MGGPVNAGTDCANKKAATVARVARMLTPAKKARFANTISPRRRTALGLVSVIISFTYLYGYKVSK
jgi:hypothetical protein